MDIQARDMLVDFLLIPPAPLVSAISHITPPSVKAAITSVVDTVKWLWSDDPSEAVLDLEVIRALQQGHPRESIACPPLKCSVDTAPADAPRPARRRASTNRVTWSPVTETINADGEVEKSPLRPGHDCMSRSPAADFCNVRLFPLVPLE
eukprot:m.230770 g.230770  ORF g.230770 m.230770 type:complete len:150 (-) comp12112_c0_seq1:244-693(-)